MDTQFTDPYASPESSVKRTSRSRSEGLERVGFGTRLLAYLADCVIFFLAYIAFSIAVGVAFATSEAMEDPEAIAQWIESNAIILSLVFYVLPAVMCVGFWTVWGATPGKMLLRIQIVERSSGEVPSIWRNLIRYIGYFISSIFLGLGFLWMIWDRDKVGWHDKMAGTVVVRKPK